MNVTPELILFDLDGVLVDTTPCHAAAWAELWSELGLPDPGYDTLAGRSTLDVVRNRTASLQPTPEQIEHWVKRKQELARGHLASRDIAFPDTAHAVRALSARGFRMAVGTSASREACSLALTRAGIADCFEVVVTSAEVPVGKPAPDIFVAAMERARTEPDATLIVEDSDAGLDAARAAGAWHVSVRTSARSDGERFLGAFEDLDALVAALGAA